MYKVKLVERYNLLKTSNINREIASLETSKQADDLNTAQLNKLVDSLESSLDSYKSVEQYYLPQLQGENVF